MRFEIECWPNPNGNERFSVTLSVLDGNAAAAHISEHRSSFFSVTYGWKRPRIPAVFAGFKYLVGHVGVYPKLKKPLGVVRFPD